jgi:hypothetical protein
LIEAIVIAAATVAMAGLLLKFVVPLIWKDSDWHISWVEFAAGLLAAYIAVIPLTFAAGKALSVADALRADAFQNGVETAADVVVNECQPGMSGGSASSGHSNCDYEYQTGETYTYTETYYVPVTKCDGDGHCTTTVQSHTRIATGYIYNPYSTREYAYSIVDSLGGQYNFPGWYVRTGESYRDNVVPAEIPRGDPQEWLDAKQRLDAGNPRPVTRLVGYDNYRLSTYNDLIKPYAKDMKRYLKEGILPDHTANIASDPTYGPIDTLADKVSFVGVNVADEMVWQNAVMVFNAALGSKFHGDLHMVIIDDSLVDNQDDYLNALKAYWLGNAFERRVIAKDVVIVVLGVSGSEISWATASTGMPMGNESMLQGIANLLPGVSLTPSEVIGAPRTVIGDEVTVTLSENKGILEQIMLSETPYKWSCNGCNDPKHAIDYSDMIVEIEPQTWQWAIMISFVGVLSLVWWFFAGANEFFNWVRLPGSRAHHYNW